MRQVAHPDKVLELRNQGKSCREIGEILGCKGNTINKILRKSFNLQVINPYRNNRKYEVDNSFLSNPNKELESYFLGIMWSDGCVVKNKDLVTISLAEKDSYILDKFTEIIQPEKPLSLRKPKTNKHQVLKRLDIFSKEIKDRLISFGCIPNKTYNLNWPTIRLTDENVAHFIRGYLDGDGCIYIDKYKSSKTAICIVGHNKFIDNLADFLSNRLKINVSIRKVSPKKNKDIRTLWIYGSRQIETFCDYVYKDATIYLTRKYDKYLLIKNRPNKRK